MRRDCAAIAGFKMSKNQFCQKRNAPRGSAPPEARSANGIAAGAATLRDKSSEWSRANSVVRP
jgi:hypothetical protein